MNIVECPRDAMQGIVQFIPTADKVRYLNQLMKVGFETIDAGSFVSPKAIPQMRDTAQVLEKLEQNNRTKLLVIIANARGAEEASQQDAVSYLGFPLSVSETFQLRNTNKTIAEALNLLNDIQEICVSSGKKLVTYISMGFGNPYGDPYSVDLVAKFVDILATLEIKTVSLADTIGMSTPEQITKLYKSLAASFPSVDLGLHLHSNPAQAAEKIEAAVSAGCNRLDGAIRGFGGCPMAEDQLVGNIATETILSVLDTRGIQTNLDPGQFAAAMKLAAEIFPA
jgi:hydroxymethylglutaryl-CoA lyase